MLMDFTGLIMVLISLRLDGMVGRPLKTQGFNGVTPLLLWPLQDAVQGLPRVPSLEQMTG